MKEFDKDLDLLLIDEIDHYILIKNLNKFASNNSHDVKTCRNCLNELFSDNKYSEHIQYCLNRKTNKIIPSFKKYLNFQNLKSCYLNDFIIISDFECVINKENMHEFVAGGYVLTCRNEIYGKPVQVFYNLEEYCSSLHSDLKYIQEV